MEPPPSPSPTLLPLGSFTIFFPVNLTWILFMKNMCTLRGTCNHEQSHLTFGGRTSLSLFQSVWLGKFSRLSRILFMKYIFLVLEARCTVYTSRAIFCSEDKLHCHYSSQFDKGNCWQTANRTNIQFLWKDIFIKSQPYYFKNLFKNKVQKVSCKLTKPG